MTTGTVKGDPVGPPCLVSKRLSKCDEPRFPLTCPCRLLIACVYSDNLGNRHSCCNPSFRAALLCFFEIGGRGSFLVRPARKGDPIGPCVSLSQSLSNLMCRAFPFTSLIRLITEETTETSKRRDSRLSSATIRDRLPQRPVSKLSQTWTMQPIFGGTFGGPNGVPAS